MISLNYVTIVINALVGFKWLSLMELMHILILFCIKCFI